MDPLHEQKIQNKKKKGKNLWKKKVINILFE